MEEKCWKQFMETGKIADYLAYREYSEGEDTRESDYSDRDGNFSVTYR